MSKEARRPSEGFTLLELLVVVAIIGIIASIALPSLMRARATANQAQAIGDTRTVTTASLAYASVNCGFFAPNLLCMTWDGPGAICIPNYPTTGPSFLGGDMARATPYSKTGYLRDYFTNGVAGGINAASCDPASVIEYCYTSTPLGPSSGDRSFSGAASGVIYEDFSGVQIPCPVPPGIQPLQQ